MQGLHSLNARTLEACCIQAIGFGRSLAITKLRWVMGVLRGRELVALDGRNGSGGPRHVSGLRLPLPLLDSTARNDNARCLSGARAENLMVDL